MYEKDGEKYFVVDGHVHFWDASPDNRIEAQQQYAKGWIESFYGYHQLGPEEYYWPMEKYQKYSEETMMKDLFEDGYVDVAVHHEILLAVFLVQDLRPFSKTRLAGSSIVRKVDLLFASFPRPFPTTRVPLYIANGIVKQDTSVSFSDNVRKTMPPPRAR